MSEEISYDKGLQVQVKFDGMQASCCILVPNQFWDRGEDWRQRWMQTHWPKWTEYQVAKTVLHHEKNCMVIFAGWKIDLFTTETGALGMTVEKCEDERRILEDDNVSVDIFVCENKDKSLSVMTA